MFKNFPGCFGAQQIVDSTGARWTTSFLGPSLVKSIYEVRLNPIKIGESVMGVGGTHSEGNVMLAHWSLLYL